MITHKIGNYLTIKLNITRKNGDITEPESFTNATSINVVMSYAPKPSIILNSHYEVSDNYLVLIYQSVDTDFQGVYNIILNYTINNINYEYQYESVEFVKYTNPTQTLDTPEISLTGGMVVGGKDGKDAIFDSSILIKNSIGSDDIQSNANINIDGVVAANVGVFKNVIQANMGFFSGAVQTSEIDLSNGTINLMVDATDDVSFQNLFSGAVFSSTNDQSNQSIYTSKINSSGGVDVWNWNSDSSINKIYSITKNGAVDINSLSINNLIEYTDNDNAIANGLTIGSLYRTGDLIKIVH